MSHWYQFEVKSGLSIVCKAERKKEIEKVLPFSVTFKGCVARDKIGQYRELESVVVMNSVNRLEAALPIIQDAMR